MHSFEPSPGGGGWLRTVAVRVDANPDVGSDPHTFVLTAARRHVVSGGTLPPDGAFFSDDEAKHAEFVYWKLTGRRVELEQTADDPVPANALGPVDSVALPNLLELAGHSASDSARLDLGHSAVDGVVLVGNGKVALEQAVPEQHTFVRFSEPDDLSRNAHHLADVVSVSLNRTRLFFHVIEASGARRAIIINGGASFTHLCACPPGKDPDIEFAGLYDVLGNPPPVPLRLVPKAVQDANLKPLGKKFSCYKAARL